MGIQPKVNYPGKIDTTDPNYPEGKAQNVTAPGDGTGTPLEQAWVNDVFGFQQKLLAASGVVPSGNPDSVAASDYFNALAKIFPLFSVYNDTGVADAYVLAPASGATVGAYHDGLVVKFIAGASNTGASTAKVGALAVTALTLAGGGALPAASVTAGQYVEAVYRTAGPRFELTDSALATPFDDSAVGITAKNVQAALVALDALVGVPAAGSVTMAKLDDSVVEVDNVNKRVAKAWANFNGTGVVAIRDSFNVSSITDSAVGIYVVNFTVAMADANYCPVIGSSAPQSVALGVCATLLTGTLPTVAGVPIIIQRSDGTDFDADVVTCAVFGNQ